MTTKPARHMTSAARDRVQHALASGADDTNPAYLFATTVTVLLLAMEDDLIDAAHLARAELANRGLDADGVWCGFDRSREIHLGAPTADSIESDLDPAVEQAVAEIAHRLLHLDTIETRNSDALDFHELAVWSIREALAAAYHAGETAAGNGHATKQEG